MPHLTATAERFVKHWGEMGNKWGINRSVAQVHAVLYISEHPLSADDLVELLGVARSNISTSIKELLSWGLIKVEHLRGDRRDHFVAIGDVGKCSRSLWMSAKNASSTLQPHSWRNASNRVKLTRHQRREKTARTARIFHNNWQILSTRPIITDSEATRIAAPRHQTEKHFPIVSFIPNGNHHLSRTLHVSIPERHFHCSCDINLLLNRISNFIHRL